MAGAIYDDRLEVTSSGTLHFGLTVESLFEPHESLPWNPLVAQVFYRRGIIEQWGRGTIKMRELTTNAGLPAPEIEDAGGCVTVRFRPESYVPRRVEREVTERQRAILSLLAGAPTGYALREIIPDWAIHLPSGRCETTCGSCGHSAWRCVRAMAEVRGGSANRPFPSWISAYLSYSVLFRAPRPFDGDISKVKSISYAFPVLFCPILSYFLTNPGRSSTWSFRRNGCAEAGCCLIDDRSKTKGDF